MRTHTFLYMSTTFQFLYFHSWIHWREGIFQTGICLAVPFPKKAPQWGAADAEIKVSSGENTELKRSPFKAWSRSVYSHTCYTYCQEFLPYLFLPIKSIHLHFFKTSPDVFPVLAVANTGSCVGPQNKIGHPAGCRFPRWVLVEYINRLQNMCYCFSGFAFRNCG